MINIANLLLTRKCNLKCGYCRISGNINYEERPTEYPYLDYYKTNEQPADWWITVIDKLKTNNPNIFFILYGGEPFLYADLHKIVQFLNVNDIPYTIISNSTPELNDIRDDFFNRVGTVTGYTASVDPLFGIQDKDIKKKTGAGVDVLKDLIKRGLTKDPVAEITCDCNTIFKVEETIKQMTDLGICSDLTVIDVAKSPYYDFSNVTEKSLLVKPTKEVRKIFDKLIESDYNIHMKSTLLEAIWNLLPANLDCKLGRNNLHNITIDSDGKLRLCLRIKGYINYYAEELFEGKQEEIEDMIEHEKQRICQGCSWTCASMSQLDYESIINH